MAPKKKVSGFIKLQIEAGAANPAPPVGPALGAHGVNIMEFCKAYNAATENQRGNVVPVEITVYEDRSFTFILKTPPAAKLLLKAAGISKGSGTPQSNKVGSVTMDQCREIAKTKNQILTPTTLKPAPRLLPVLLARWESSSRVHNTLCGRARFGSDHPQPSHT